MNDDDPELGALLALLHRADDPFTTVQATYRIWRHDDRASAAFLADVEEQKRRGASVGTIQLTSRERSPAEHEELLRIHCVFVEPSERPKSPAQISLNYNSDDGHERVNLSQCAGNEKRSQYDELIRGDGWDEVIRDGTTIRVTRPGAAGNQMQAHLERDGTFVFLMSETLGPEELTNIAAGLRPAPSTSSI